MAVGTPDVEVIDYTPTPTGQRFLDDRNEVFFRQLIGPIGSGKSVVCTMDLAASIAEMPPALDGWRRQRNAVVRNTYRELEDTTMRTVFDWLPKENKVAGFSWSESDMTWTYHDEEAKVHFEWLFRALDRPDHIKKLLSLELTNAWVNENREVPWAITDMLIGRLGRYPSMRDYGWETDPETAQELARKVMDEGYVPEVGVDVPYAYYIIGDTNPPDDESDIYRVFEEERPPNCRVYHQPSARSPQAENLQNLHPLYYPNLMAGKTEDWIRVYVDGLYGYVADGKAIHPLFSQTVHVSEQADDWDDRLGAAFGCDFGLTPAAAIGQKQTSGQWRIREEVVTENTGAERFGEELIRVLNGQRYAGIQAWRGWGDPSGDDRSPVRETESVLSVLQGQGLPIAASPDLSNDFTMRTGALDYFLTRLDMMSRPSIVIHPRCKTLIKGLAGRYCYRRIQAPGEARYALKPDKNKWSHVCEGLHYLLLGEGEGGTLLAQGRASQRPKVHRALRSARIRRDNAGAPTGGVRIL